MSNFKSFTIYSIGFFSLILGLVLNENSSGGAKIDFNILFPFIESFSSNFESGLVTYIDNPRSIIHSPVFYILIGLFYKITDNIILIKILYIFLCSFFPFIFFIILRDKFKIDKNILFIFSLIIFLSPYFRSSAIWLLGDNLSLIFFGLSIFILIKFMNLIIILKYLSLCFFLNSLLLYQILLLFVFFVLYVLLFSKTR